MEINEFLTEGKKTAHFVKIDKTTSEIDELHDDKRFEIRKGDILYVVGYIDEKGVLEEYILSKYFDETHFNGYFTKLYNKWYKLNNLQDIING